MTQRDPDDRPADAAAALTLLAAARRGELQLETSDPASHPTVVVPVPAPAPVVPLTPAPVADTALSGVVVADPHDRTPTKRNRIWLPLTIIVVLALVVGGAAWWLGSGRYTTVPGIVGANAKQAEALLTEAGLTWEYGPEEFSEIVPAGKVLSSDPEPGERVRTDGTVTVVLSKGPERYDVPKVTGLTLEDATKELEARTLTVGTVDKEFSDTVPKGRVISSSPKAGTEVRAETVIDLVVSKGLPPVEVPNVVGSTFDAASAELAGLGLQIRKVDERYRDGTTAGEVLSQSPASGARVVKGTTIEVVVSLGPPLVEVPDVTFDSVSDATATLEAAGFTVQAEARCSVLGCTRIVLDQNPNGGTKAPRGSTVVIFYA
jgi:serine/threonine-protein kinase